jgi:hypothetical protein
MKDIILALFIEQLAEREEVQFIGTSLAGSARRRKQTESFIFSQTRASNHRRNAQGGGAA